jgi:heme-degrading monooxygenase HmoA
MLEIHTKIGKAKEYSNVIHDKVLPILQKQPGFMDEITLVDTANPDHRFALSFWLTEADAERYDREQFPKVNEIIRPLLEMTPKVQTFTVDSFTSRKIAKGMAA